MDVGTGTPTAGGLVRLARVQPFGTVLDVVFGLFGRAIARQVDGLVAQQSRDVPSSRP